jgi:hypothetical protein
MVGKTDAERKQDERDRKAALGLSRYEFWLTESQSLRVMRYILRMRKAEGTKFYGASVNQTGQRK